MLKKIFCAQLQLYTRVANEFKEMSTENEIKRIITDY